ncbi:DnaD domain protein [Clostridium aciditolerans]|uniref:DnaD domain protein n=1 Tax=Clostridium aciditolerans TaxID=339861 RepID=A0A934I062_9CLOT|nr:DnaD domain protein [Clostridium aciditolerans]MBI6873610.1 DnaD domain protein [Clostridium aciditolerans]
MATYRQIQTSFWQDGFIMELTPEEKYFYFYLMTNQKTTQCGIFEIPRLIIEAETGYNGETVDKLIKRFVDYGKILYCKETKEIMIVNWIKYNFINSKNTMLCINKELKKVKNKDFVNGFYKICVDMDYPLDIIFKGINLYENSDSEKEELSGGLQAPCNDLGEEEAKKEIYKKAANKEANNTDGIGLVICEFNKNMGEAALEDIEKIAAFAEEFDNKVILEAIYEAVKYKAKSSAYIWSILENWKSLGLITMDKLKKYRNIKKESNKCNADAYKYIE